MNLIWGIKELGLKDKLSGHFAKFVLVIQLHMSNVQKQEETKEIETLDRRHFNE